MHRMYNYSYPYPSLDFSKFLMHPYLDRSTTRLVVRSTALEAFNTSVSTNQMLRKDRWNETHWNEGLLQWPWRRNPRSPRYIDYTHARTRTHPHTHTRTHTHARTLTRTHTRARAHAHTHTHTHTRAHAHTHTHTNTHTRTHTWHPPHELVGLYILYFKDLKYVFYYGLITL